MRLTRRRQRPEWARDPSGERVLAAAADDTGGVWLLATRTHLAAVPPPGTGVERVWPWEQIQAADWEQESGRLRVSEVGEFGRPRERREFRLEPSDTVDRLLRMIRERVTASVVLQRRVPLDDGRGLTVIARRPIGGPLLWMVEYDDGVDPADPGVERFADAALAEARSEVGE